MPPRPLNPQQEVFVSAYVGEARRNATEAARIAGYKQPNMAGPRLMGNDGIRAAIAEYRAAIRTEGIANQQHRVDCLVERHRLMQTIIESRAARYQAATSADSPEAAAAQAAKRVFGGDVPYEATTGLLVAKESMTGSGPRIVEYSLDAPLLKAMLEHEKQAAQETGQWVEKGELTGAGGGPVTFAYEEVSPGERPSGPLEIEP